MVVELEEPFKSKWRKGYILFSSGNRRSLHLYNNHDDKTTISYARYLMGVKLGYFVPDGYEVDHIDNDRTNDDIDNLQLLTSEENRIKYNNWYRDTVQKRHTLSCTYCKKPFVITERDLRFRKKETICCSRSCSGKLYNTLEDFRNKGLNKINEDSLNRIKHLRAQGLSSYKISDMTGFARNTIMKYW